jgi:hypothetical protein
LARPKELSTGAATDGSDNGVCKRAEIDVLGSAGDNVAADGAADNLDDEVDE